MKNKRLTKKILLIIAVFAFGISMLLLSLNISADTKCVSAETINQENDFTFTDDGANVTITGVTAEVKALTNVDLIIPNTINGYAVTSIGASAFTNWTGLTSVTLPESITAIGSQAFYGTTNLTTINYNAANVSDLTNSSNAFYNAGKNGTGITLNIGASVAKIPAYIFYSSSTTYSPKITAVNFAQDCALTSIGNYAFYNNTNLTGITIPSGSVGSYAFYNCTNLKSLTISSGVTSLSNYSFYNCTGLTEINFDAESMADLSTNIYTFGYAGNSGTGITVNIGTSATKIPANLFCPYYSNTSSSPKIITVNFAEDSVCTSIGTRAFDECYRLKNINIPPSVTTINTYAFTRCYGLTDITIPSTVTTIGSYAFQNCYGLTNLTIPSGVTAISTYTFDGCYGLASLTIPSSISTIGSYAFQGCYGLTSINIPNSVTSIGANAFTNCYGITEITVDADNTVYESAGNCLIQKSNNTLVLGCKTSVIPDTVTTIGSYAFAYCTSLTSITIPDTVTSIGTYAFQNCTGLTHITLPANITTINSYIFQNCTELTNITLPNNITSINSYAFYNCNKMTEIVIPDKVTSIGSYTFQNCTLLASITLPESLTAISDYVFYNCTSLNNVVLPSRITSISSNLFGSCTSLANITIPSSITSIGSYAFRNCTSLKNIRLPESVTTIYTYAFYGCTGLTEIIIPSKVTSISNYAFYGCTSLSNISIPDNITSIGTYAFYGCNKLKSIRIPNKVTTIGTQAFYNCTSLTSIAIPASVTNIASNAFYNCSSLTIYAEIAEDAQPSGWVSSWNPSNRPIVWSFSTEITLTLNYNYIPAENDTRIVEFNTTYELGAPSRNYYAFVGWFSEADGGIQYTDANGASINIWSEPANRTVYARWEWIPVHYSINSSTVETDTGTILSGSAVLEVIDKEGEQTDTITLNQKGYITAYFHTDYTTEVFTTWMVKRNDSATFDSLGSGVSIPNTDGRDAEQRLDLYSNGIYLINENFLDTYLQSNGEIIFKAVYTNSTPQFVTIETDDKTFGTVQVDGITMLFDQNGKIVNNYAQDYTGDITIKITPKNYRAVDKVQISTDDIIWTVLENNGTANEYSTPVTSGLRIKIVYTTPTYTINVTAQTTGDEIVSGEAVNNPTGIIGLAAPNDVFNTATLNKTIPGYRLVANSTNNIKIFNYPASRYEYFSAINGNINLSIDEAFLEKFLKNGEVEVIAIYIKQFTLSTDVINPELGKVMITVEEPNGNYYDNPEFSQSYDEGSTAIINAIANNGSTVTNTTGINPEEQIYEDMFILTLTGDRAITITFGAQQYTLNTKAVNMNNEIINSISVTPTASALNLLDFFSIEKGSSFDYEFIGWYAEIGDNYVLYDDIDRDLSDIQVNESFVRDYADNYEINIAARYAKRYSAEISCTSGGKINEIEIIEGDEPLTEGMYKENTVLKINFTVDRFYYLSGVDGLYEAETVESDYIIIKIDGFRVISLNFAPEIFTVISNNNLSNASGKINILTDQLTLGSKAIITFNTDSGYEITDWKINGMTVAQINSKYEGANAVKNGNTVTFTVTEGWLNDFESKLDSTVKTSVDSTLLKIFIAALVSITLLVTGILLMLRANKKRKAAYAKAVMIRDQRTKGMNMASMVRQLREGTSDPLEDNN